MKDMGMRALWISSSLALILGSGFAWGQTADSTNGWGYRYSALLQDLNLWKQSPYVHVDSIGASRQKRALWMITLTNGTETGKQRIFIHARTHPAEVQAFYVTREMIRFLLDTNAVATQIRKEFVFHIIPMYNPDGVELGYGRLNGNRVDIESNWDKTVLEPEVIALKAKFTELMGKSNPIRVALNMHADQVNCTRFFFYHDPVATSQNYGVLERNFIGGVQTYFPTGIRPWNYLVSWSDGFKTQYPESFWWMNYHESVMALTYEDTNCPDAGKFDSTGRAITLGAVDYVRTHATVQVVMHNRNPAILNVERTGNFPVLLFRNGNRIEYIDLRGRR